MTMRPLRPKQAEAMDVWLPVVGYEGSYEVSDAGHVRSLDRIVDQVNRWGTCSSTTYRGCMLRLALSVHPDGHRRLQVSLHLAGRAKTHAVHVLVAAAFLGPKPNGCEIAHNDGNSLNNALKNLRYATPVENAADKFLHGTQHVGSRCYQTRLSKHSVTRLRSIVGILPIELIATEFGMSSSHIGRIQNGKRWKHVA